MKVLALALMLGAAAPADAQPGPRATALQRAQQELASGRRVEAKRLLADAADRFRSVQALLLLSRVQSEDGDAAGALIHFARRAGWRRTRRRCSAPSRRCRSPRGRRSLRLWHSTRSSASALGVMQYHYLLGVALLRVGDRLNAVGALQAAEQLEPNRALTLLALGIAHNSLQQYADAKPVLARAVELDPGNADTLAALAEAEQGLGELDAASKHVQQVLALAPQHATANLVAGLVAMDRSQYAEARAALERAVQTDPAAVQGALSIEPRVCAPRRRGGRQPVTSNGTAQTLRGVQKMIDELRMATGPTRNGFSPTMTRGIAGLLALALAQGAPSGQRRIPRRHPRRRSDVRPSRRPRKEVHRRIDERRRCAVRLRQRRAPRHLLRRFADRGHRRRSEAGAQRALPESWRLQVQRRHRQSRRRPPWLGHGRLHRRRRRRRVGGLVRDRAWRQQALSQRSRRDVQRRHGAGRRRWRRLVGGLRIRRLRSRWRPRSLRQPLREGRPPAAAAVRARQDLPVPRRAGAVRAARPAG